MMAEFKNKPYEAIAKMCLAIAEGYDNASKAIGLSEDHPTHGVIAAMLENGARCYRRFAEEGTNEQRLLDLRTLKLLYQEAIALIAEVEKEHLAPMLIIKADEAWRQSRPGQECGMANKILVKRYSPKAMISYFGDWLLDLHRIGWLVGE